MPGVHAVLQMIPEFPITSPWLRLVLNEKYQYT